MAQETVELDNDLADSIKRALQAASVANDAAEEVAGLSDQSRKAVQDALTSQKRLSAVALGALIGSVVSLGLGGLIYLRSVADLREAAELQAIANKAAIEQVQALATAVQSAQGTLTDLGALNDQIAARIDGLGDRFSGDLSSFAAEASALQPQFASAIQKHIDDGLTQTRGEILTALAEMEAAAPQTGGADPELIRLLSDVRDRLKTPTPAKAPAKPSAPAKPKPKPKPASEQGAATSPFRYP
jgi:hypothetical protein